MGKRYLALILTMLAQPGAPVRAAEVCADAPLRQVMLDGQNAVRAAVGVAPLAWDDTLAAHARDHARKLARERRFEHAVQPNGPEREGENLWAGTRQAYRYGEMVGSWTGERTGFVNGSMPAISRTGDWRRVGHYSQIVWRGTMRVGCAMASNRTDDYLVCRYSPVGNVAGERVY